MKWCVWLSVCVACALGACRAELPGGYYGCDDGNCPPGQRCDLRDRRCYLEQPQATDADAEADGGADE